MSDLPAIDASSISVVTTDELLEARIRCLEDFILEVCPSMTLGTDAGTAAVQARAHELLRVIRDARQEAAK